MQWLLLLWDGSSQTAVRHLTHFPKSSHFQADWTSLSSSITPKKTYLSDPKVWHIYQTPACQHGAGIPYMPGLSIKCSGLWNHSCFSRFSVTFHQTQLQYVGRNPCRQVTGLSPFLPVSTDYCWFVCSRFPLILSIRSPQFQNDLNSPLTPWVFIAWADAKPPFW